MNNLKPNLNPTSIQKLRVEEKAMELINDHRDHLETKEEFKINMTVSPDGRTMTLEGDIGKAYKPSFA